MSVEQSVLPKLYTGLLLRRSFMSDSEMTVRFRDADVRIRQFENTILVVCPQCSHWAEITWVKQENQRGQGDGGRRFTCTWCGLTRDRRRLTGNWRKDSAAYSEWQEWISSLALWLEASCCGERLWACNAD